MKHLCKRCECVVVDGENGDVYEPAPWMDPQDAMCYGCQNRAEQEAEIRHLESLIDAAQRAGRFDLI